MRFTLTLAGIWVCATGLEWWLHGACYTVYKNPSDVRECSSMSSKAGLAHMAGTATGNLPTHCAEAVYESGKRADRLGESCFRYRHHLAKRSGKDCQTVLILGFSRC